MTGTLDTTKADATLEAEIGQAFADLAGKMLPDGKVASIDSFGMAEDSATLLVLVTMQDSSTVPVAPSPFCNAGKHRRSRQPIGATSGWLLLG